MNVHRVKKRLRRVVRNVRRRIKRRISHLRYGKSNNDKSYNNSYSRIDFIRNIFYSKPMLYLVYVVAASLLCILMSQATPNSQFRKWYYALTNKETINKGVERDNMIDVAGAIPVTEGQFITHYRYNKLGETNPEEIDPNAPMIAFTFDDGPSSKATQRILDALEENYSHATFFVVGRQTEQFPELLQAIISCGCEIGNHTSDHVDLTELSVEDIEEQIDVVDRSVKKATGEVTTVIRPPYGAYDERVMGVLTRPIILWDVDSEDWESRNAYSVCDKVLTEVKDGDIVLMHDIYDSTAEAVEILLPKLKEQGYQIVSVSEMAMYKGKSLELGKAYGKIAE